MPEYTRIDKNPDRLFNGETAPLLLYQKWQPWDAFHTNTNKKYDRTNCRLGFLEDIATAVQDIYNNNKYNTWFERYKNALKSQNANLTESYKTLWRLLIGWGNNSTLESGLTLHYHLGFPYLPGSAVKGVVHHAAEMGVMQLLDPEPPVDEPEQKTPSALERIDVVQTAIKELQLIRILFGSIHLEKPKDKNKHEFGPECPQSFLNKLQKDIRDKWDEPPAGWKTISNEISELLKDHTGAMLRFYDAVPEPGQSGLLQTDIVNNHYTKYYGSEGSDTPPSDDQSPIPVTFLAIKPGADFLFPFYIANLPNSSEEHDDEEKKRIKILQEFTRDDLHKKVKLWLQIALSEWGIGAKTAAGYGYMKRIDRLIPEEPPAYTRSRSIRLEISSDFNQPVWQQFDTVSWIERVTKMAEPTLRQQEGRFPRCEILREGKILEIHYKNGEFFCHVQVSLGGVTKPEQAQFVWLECILPELQKIT